MDFTRPWYTKIIPFPLNFFLPGRKQKAASLRVFLTKGGENISDSDVEAKVKWGGGGGWEDYQYFQCGV